MKAIVTYEFNSEKDLIITELPVPEIGNNEVLVKVKAISINPVDVKTRIGKGLAGRFKNEMPVVLGWDISGVVTESNSLDFKKGDEVFGMVNFPGQGKAYAKYVAAPAAHLALKPANISDSEAAAACLAALTAYQLLVHQANVKVGQRVLIHAAAGGVGHYAVQIARHLGAYVIGTSSAAKKDFVKSLGADEHIDYKTSRFEDLTDNIDFVLDTVGGDNIDRSLKVIKRGGMIVSIPTGLNKEVAEKADSLGIKGIFFLVQSNGEDMKQLANMLEKGIIKSYIDRTYSFNEMRKAHEQVESGRTKGKVIVSVTD